MVFRPFRQRRVQLHPVPPDASDVDVSGIDVVGDAPVLVTGATGYVASWIVAALLRAGVHVHAAVRNPDDLGKVQHLLRAAQGTAGKLTLFRTDLLTPGSYAEAMAGCGIVMHTASPFIRHVDDPQRDLVDPAVSGTRNVLDSVDETPTVTRVVLTSSIASVFTDASETEQAPGGMADESTWNTTASLDNEPYNYSKTLAEREAWAIAERQDRWRLVVINPSVVIGPALNPNPTSGSFAIMKQLGGGDMRFGAPRLGLAAVDVRDIARAHIAAAYLPDAAGRHIVSGGETDVLRMGYMLLPDFGDAFPLPHWGLPKPLFSLIAPTVGVTRRYAAGNVGHRVRLDTSKSVRELGMRYRPLPESLNEMFAQMVAAGDFD